MYLCYHHDDMDGKTSGFHVYQHLEQIKAHPKASDFIMRGYDEPFSEKDYGGKDVFIVDLSFTKKSISALFDICEGAHSVVWIDHHKSSVEAIEDDDIKEKLDKYDNLEYFVDTRVSATILTYLYFKFLDKFGVSPAKELASSDMDMEIHWCNAEFTKLTATIGDYDITLDTLPMYLQYVDRYDRWVYGDDDRPLLFSYGCMTHNTNLFAYPDKSSRDLEFNSNFWNRIHMYTFTGDIIEDGRTAKKYADVTNKMNRDEAAYEREVLGYKAIILNTFGNSMVFGENAPKDYDVLIIYTYNGKSKLFTYSFYSSNPEVDCSKIAAHFDPKGGGHKGAAGCSSKEFLFK